jgi:hypothetical protein
VTGDGKAAAPSAKAAVAALGPKPRLGAYDEWRRWKPFPEFEPALDEDGKPKLTPSGDYDQQHLAYEDRRFDWPTIKARYVEGVKPVNGDTFLWPTTQEVADYYGCSVHTLREKSTREGWLAQRTQWQAQVEARRREARANALVQKAVNLDTKALSAAEAGIGLCMARLQEIGQAHQTARTAAGPGAASTGVIDALEQTRLAQAIDLWHKIGLRAVGEPEAQRIELTGANGAPLEITAELRRDDPNRIATVLGVLEQAGLGDLFGGPDRRLPAVARGQVVGVEEADGARR